MARRNSIIVFTILTAIGILGSWAVGLFETDGGPREVSRLELLIASFGFLLSLAAIIGMVLFIRQKRGPISESDISDWAILRKRGKPSYVRKGLLTGALLGLLGVLIPLISLIGLGLPFNSLWVLPVILLTGVLGGYYGAIRKWDSNEADYAAFKHPKSRSGTNEA